MESLEEINAAIRLGDKACPPAGAKLLIRGHEAWSIIRKAYGDWLSGRYLATPRNTAIEVTVLNQCAWRILDMLVFTATVNTCVLRNSTISVPEGLLGTQLFGLYKLDYEVLELPDNCLSFTRWMR